MILIRLLMVAMTTLFLGVLAAGAGGVYVFWHYGKGLPDYRDLADYEPPVTTRVYAGDGRLLAEYAKQQRIFVPIEEIPPMLAQAFISAEDQHFRDHFGIDLRGIARAAITNARNIASGAGSRLQGASTITQQVAKNFFLTNEVSVDRKIKEAILAIRMERFFDKDHILELYLNEIYLGQGAYGVAAAGLTYFNKALEELTLSEMAFLAALPKAPNNYHPVRNPDAARARRNYVLDRLHEDGHITLAMRNATRGQPIILRQREEQEVVQQADFFAEEVRREIADRYGEDALYLGGLAVRTTVEPDMQREAVKALRAGLLAYDRRHGWRGPLGELTDGRTWRDDLAGFEPPPGLLPNWEVAVVLFVKDDERHAVIGFTDGRTAELPFSELAWAREWREDQRVGPEPDAVSDVLTPGQVIAVENVSDQPISPDNPDDVHPAGTYALRQIPNVDGALVAMDPHTGRVLAMAGGFSYERSEFNRATQAQRQPGSAFKPFVYLSALDHGFTPSTLILDGPVEFSQGPGLPPWRPKNYSGDFAGPTTLRRGLERSKNLMTVRLAHTVGMPTIAAYAENFGIVDDLPEVLSMSLGAGETTLMRLTAAYGMLVNGGKRVTPTLIDRVQDRRGETVFRHDGRPCLGCEADRWDGGPPPLLPDTREQVADPQSAYQIVHILEGVVQYGTGRRVAAVGKPIAGKTGTTNDSFDTWFMGFTPDLVAGVFVGFDDPRTLGPRETGSSVAAPIFQDFMTAVLQDAPATPFRRPPGLRFVRVDHETGRRPESDGRVITEAFKPGDLAVLDTRRVVGDTGSIASDGPLTADGQGAVQAVPELGGLY